LKRPSFPAALYDFPLTDILKSSVVSLVLVRLMLKYETS
jgi:hypothetical protein